jgi:acyl-CoA dehydrogenase
MERGEMMEMDYTGHQKSIAGFVAKLAKKYDRSYWCKKAESEYFLHEMWEDIAKSGYFGMVIPEEYGGSNFSYTDLIIFLEELGRHGIITLHFVSFFMDCVLVMHGDEELKRKFLPLMSSGTYFSFAITEPDAGSNTFKIRTRATRDGEYYRITGQKIYITGADESEYMVVVTRSTPYEEVDDKRSGISLFIVDSHSAGISMQLQNVEIFSPERQYTVFFDDVKVPAKNLIGEEGKGVDYLFDGLNLERIVVAAYCLGLGKYALHKAIEYANERNIFGGPIGSYQGLQHPLARAYVGLRLASLANHAAAKAMDKENDRRLVGLYANMAKLSGSEEAFKACDIAIQVHGGGGLTREYDVINISNMVRAMRVAPVSNELILNYISQQYLKLPRSY